MNYTTEKPKSRQEVNKIVSEIITRLNIPRNSKSYDHYSAVKMEFQDIGLSSREYEMAIDYLVDWLKV